MKMFSPMEKFNKPEDLGAFVSFLCSRRGNFFSGLAIHAVHKTAILERRFDKKSSKYFSITADFLSKHSISSYVSEHSALSNQ